MENAEVIAEFLQKRVRIMAHDVCFEGIVRFVDLQSGVLCLDRVIDVAYGKKSLGMLMFPGKDISFIRILDKTKSQHPTESQTTQDAAKKQTKMVDVQSIGTGVSAVKEDPSTEHLPYELISKLQEKFSSAIQYIKGEQVVGVVAKGLTISRFGKLSWLQISTKRMLFLFDILSIGAEGFKNGLKSVLQDETILKVVHDCRLLSDCTYHQFGVYLSNVFDTQVADAIITKESSGGKWPCKVKTLRECLYNYLPRVTLPPAQQKRHDCLQATEAAWMTRPCPNRLLNAATAEAWHLLSLREALLERMMAPFTSCVDFYLGYYRNAPDDKHRNFPSESMDLLSELPSVYEAEAASPRLSENAQRSGSRRQDLSE